MDSFRQGTLALNRVSVKDDNHIRTPAYFTNSSIDDTVFFYMRCGEFRFEGYGGAQSTKSPDFGCFRANIKGKDGHLIFTPNFRPMNAYNLENAYRTNRQSFTQQ
ncbi:hypothetical protein SAMD00019534_125570 [Acytostelium subglobosum LB1]|uniref:hypothetical protein n=1 Tax=Acytostelium subglobosum LB1 TaxID=1410327 RepID=UPI000645154F|nr:hypothetical protein SAMD00019534_125570 [Acytostelium subglobosum LB1]GAM29381.1 hypothetical protein SAMD00019534_125570 [Acytostelium subglobosum LB1]|eukprot:XP_012747686.1 hypothetical protein SAMD00019534_125570 [Acytostelium subglobosum LB1]